MANISNLLRRVNTLLDDEPLEDDVIDWFNQCQETLTSYLYMPSKTTISKTGDVFPIPADFNGIIDVLSPEYVTNLLIIDNNICFDELADTSSITILYNKLPADLTNSDSLVPGIPKQFHQVYVLYACMQAMHPEEEPERYAQYERDYLRIKNDIKIYMDKQKPKLDRWVVER